MLVGHYKTLFPEYQIKRNWIYKEILKYNNIDFIELSISDHDFWEKVKTVDLFLFRFSHADDDLQLTRSILPIIENYLSIKCFPNQDTCWHFDDKIKEYYLLKNLGYPVIDTWIFWEEEKALEWADKAEYPIVFKLKKGAGSSNVILIHNKTEANIIIKKMFGRGITSNGSLNKRNIKFNGLTKIVKNEINGYILKNNQGKREEFWLNEKKYVLFQKFLPNNYFDTRVSVVGERAFANRRFVRKNDFRASGSGNGDFDREKIDLRTVELALKISKDLNFQSMAYDFLMDEAGEPRICEMSWTFPDFIEKGFWDKNLNWNSFSFVPPYFHLVDALGNIDLKYPETINLKLSI